jgi:predicted RNase H-like HicB family nuclease
MGETKVNTTFTVIIQREENWYVASCLENNVASQGTTVDESVKNLKEALALYYEEDRDLPERSPVFVTTVEVAL